MIPPLETNSGGLAKDMTLRDAVAIFALSGLSAAFARVERRGKETQAEADVRWAWERASAFMIERERGE